MLMMALPICSSVPPLIHTMAAAAAVAAEMPQPQVADKVTVIGSHLCPDTLYAPNRLSEAKAEIDFKNMSASPADMKAYLALRQDSPVYADIRENGGIGIPCFVLEDGTVTRDLETILK